VNYILHHNSLEDFLLRNRLPVSEQQLVEQNSKFWNYLEGLTK
jgi:mRNA interferase RelE/StbE